MIDLHRIGDFLMGLQISQFIRESDWAFPAVESVHVVAVLLVVGTIAIVDLRLLGIPSNDWALTELSRDTLRWTWLAFALAAVSGSLLLMAKANNYFVVPSLWAKFACMAGAAINMLIFETLTFRHVHRWNQNQVVPLAGKIAGSLSLGLWTLVVVFGRWIGYTIDHGTVFGHGF